MGINSTVSTKMKVEKITEKKIHGKLQKPRENSKRTFPRAIARKRRTNCGLNPNKQCPVILSRLAVGRGKRTLTQDKGNKLHGECEQWKNLYEGKAKRGKNLRQGRGIIPGGSTSRSKTKIRRGRLCYKERGPLCWQKMRGIQENLSQKKNQGPRHSDLAVPTEKKTDVKKRGPKIKSERVKDRSTVMPSNISSGAWSDRGQGQRIKIASRMTKIPSDSFGEAASLLRGRPEREGDEKAVG